jgi:hypothetical protein
MPKLKRETEMVHIKKKIQKLLNRLKELNYTVTDHYSVLCIFDELEPDEDKQVIGGF